MIANLDHLNLSVRNFDETAEWYNRVFGFNIVEKGTYRGHPWGVLQSGDAMLCIYECPDRSFVSGDSLSETKQHGFNHFALKITDRDTWQKTIRQQNLTINYGGPVKWPTSVSWYVNDPTGYEIEVVSWTSGRPDFSQAAYQST